MKQKNLPVLEFLPDQLSPEDQLLTWQTCVKPFFDAQPVTSADAERFTSSSTWYQLDNVVMTQTRFSASHYRRDKKWLAQHDDSEHLTFQLYLEGSNLGVNGQREFFSSAGNITVIDMAKEIHARADDSHLLTLVIPRHLMKNPDNLNGVTLPAESVRARVLREHMLTLWQSLPDILVEKNHLFTQATIGLIEGLFAREISPHQEERTEIDKAVITSMKNYLEEHLKSPHIGVDSLCRTFYCSRSTLYRLFKPYGGVAQYIRERRLKAAFRDLIQPSNAKLRISDVAMEYRFNSLSSFSRQFRQCFGVNPSDVASPEVRSHYANSMKNQQVIARAESVVDWLKSL